MSFEKAKCSSKQPIETGLVTNNIIGSFDCSLKWRNLNILFSIVKRTLISKINSRLLYIVLNFCVVNVLTILVAVVH